MIWIFEKFHVKQSAWRKVALRAVLILKGKCEISVNREYEALHKMMKIEFDAEIMNESSKCNGLQCINNDNNIINADGVKISQCFT